ncbi:MAG: 50S ribosomal protein L35 [Crenarchaeota archaeon]|nr:50S ribosomal protein L35 [Thermoproteota archaeon]
MMARIVGLIYSFRRGADAYPDNVIVVVPGIEDSAVLHRFLGCRVIWRTKTGKEIIGKVRKVWSERGHLLVVFRRPLPGQALGTRCEIEVPDERLKDITLRQIA